RIEGVLDFRRVWRTSRGALILARSRQKAAKLTKVHDHADGGRDLPDFFGPFQSWRTASVASVEQYRCLNSSGVR
ncbi:hypothetical protein, partial [Burkholderia pseudomallei]|uniref:hypothetical protein n=1 Tax=Burkholderia pseudomallei TaxID=28450 RepID=UPI001F3300AD